ncbi:NAD(P)/FAD-dependent oxidoreductase [Algicella marina]|uniref:FAD-dependent oxidoreductase n=1 Tax=Algicella marina TaxID=2683284 RepID=A0A6P1T094_9RHOB|nr:FAD-dependent oxidoreductase [Algicella marina]QHQ35427.1 FAD-dependent oxidoreductase [Algicella marina]
MATRTHDFIVVGGGIVGAAVAEGLARRGCDVAILDEGDVAIRAARGNLGNVWVQGKGAGNPPYADLTRKSALDWQGLADRLRQQTGIDVHYEKRGAVFLCFSEAELEKRTATMEKSAQGVRIENRYEMLNHAGVARLFPMIGPDVLGGSYSAEDGTANPLYLLRALIKSATLNGCAYIASCGVSDLRAEAGGFVLQTEQGEFRTNHVALCAGLGNARLAPQLNLFGDVRPVRGQIMVTERLQPFLPLNVSFIRQTVEGSCVIGESSEDAGYDTGTTVDVLKDTAERAIRAFPHLQNAGVVRTWGALRIMTPDGAPVYQMRGFGRGSIHKATVVSVHSGVTLSPFHAEDMAVQIAGHELDTDIARAFAAERFDV